MKPKKKKIGTIFMIVKMDDSAEGSTIEIPAPEGTTRETYLTRQLRAQCALCKHHDMPFPTVWEMTKDGPVQIPLPDEIPEEVIETGDFFVRLTPNNGEMPFEYPLPSDITRKYVEEMAKKDAYLHARTCQMRASYWLKTQEGERPVSVQFILNTIPKQ